MKKLFYSWVVLAGCASLGFGTEKSHWSFQPMSNPEPPSVVNEAWCRTDLDRFILARLEAEGMQPAAEVDRRTFVRRAYFDLIGLPPSFEQVEAFAGDRSPDAFEKLIDQLLASPHYGERWGRHWLDIARFADTRGYLVGGEDVNFPYAYTYRDYVIKALNDDKPYDEFIREQLAADQLEVGDDKQKLAAMGFLTVGRRFLNKQEEIIDDRIDLVSRGLMGLTVYCSRCHDHKYDPVPTDEYYSLYSIFDNSEEPEELPIIHQPEESDAYTAYKVERDKRKAAVDGYVEQTWKAILKENARDVGNYLEEIARKKRLDLFEGTETPEYVTKNSNRRFQSDRWTRFLERDGTRDLPMWILFHHLMDVPQAEFQSTYSRLLPKVHPALRERMEKSPPNRYSDLLTVYTRFFRELARVPDEQLTAAQKEVREYLGQAGTPSYFDRAGAEHHFNRGEKDEQRKLEAKVRQWESSSPGAPPRAMVLVDKSTLHDNHVFVRGNKRSPGEKVARQFLRVASSDTPTPYTKGSGRLELANSIVSENNPFTWRIIVNRVWQHHMGEGIVPTSSDFGTRGALPSHPALLDFLAQKFVQEGKSLKKMHREIMLSSTYRMAGEKNRAYVVKDPDNRLLSHMNRRRLEMEPMRDAMLTVSGLLDRTVGGRSVAKIIAPEARRRTIYGHVDRQDVPGFYRSFDFANPDATTGNRPETTVPQQALFAMNSPFVRAQAEALAHGIKDITDHSQRVEALYRRVLSRTPSRDEVHISLAFIEQDAPDLWTRFAQVLLMSNEFLFVD